MERMLQRNAIRHMSGLQKAILQSLSTMLHPRQRAKKTVGVPYLDVVHAVAADKTTVTMNLCQLMRRGLVLLFVPPGGWTRYVALTEQGQEYVRFLDQAARQPKAKEAPRAMEEHEEPTRRQHASTRRRARSRERRQGRDDRRARQRFR